MKKFGVGMCLVALFGAGCVRQTVVRPPRVTPPVSPLLGVWENLDKGQSRGRMIFEPGGRLTFQGGMEYFNPGRWELDPRLQELRITLPEADVDKLQIFQMYIGEGVKAFDPAQKQVVYHFDDDTSALNVGGWMYSKAGPQGGEKVLPPEPELK